MNYNIFGVGFASQIVIYNRAIEFQINHGLKNRTKNNHSELKNPANTSYKFCTPKNRRSNGCVCVCFFPCLADLTRISLVLYTHDSIQGDFHTNFYIAVKWSL